MKYFLLILTLLVGIGLSANLYVNGTYYGATANTNYDWTLDKTANNYELVFSPAPDPAAQSVLFTINITRSVPYSLVNLNGHIEITNNGSTPATITNVTDSIAYFDPSTSTWHFVYLAALFSGSHILDAGATWAVPMNITFSSPYPLGPFAYHHNYVKVYTDDNGIFTYEDAFHVDFPGVVNETLHVWDQYTVPTGFTATPIWNPDYNGSYWTTVSGNATLYLSLSITNASAPVGTFVLKNKGSGINECGLWQDSVLITLRDTTPPDTGFHGTTLTPGYWKNHPLAYQNWLPITFAGVTVSNTNQGYTILSRSGQSSSPWYKFLCHFFCTILNTKNSPGMLSAYYNDMTHSGEFMEGQQVAYIISVANTYRSNTPSATLLAMKDVCDAMNQDNQNVLWNTPNGGSGSTVSLRNSSSIILYPNPFSSGTEIRFSTNNNEPVTLKVYDISGTKVRDLVKNANSTLYWDGTDNNGKMLTRGVYIIRTNNTTLKALINR
jgi:uncharacterized protein (DUF2147 family)